MFTNTTITILCLGCFVAPSCAAQQRTDQEAASTLAVERLTKAGGKVTVAPDGGMHVDLSAQLASKDVVAALKSLSSLRSLNLLRTGVDDEILQEPKALTGLLRPDQDDEQRARQHQEDVQAPSA